VSGTAEAVPFQNYCSLWFVPFLRLPWYSLVFCAEKVENGCGCSQV